MVHCRTFSVVACSTFYRFSLENVIVRIVTLQEQGTLTVGAGNEILVFFTGFLFGESLAGLTSSFSVF